MLWKKYLSSVKTNNTSEALLKCIFLESYCVYYLTFFLQHEFDINISLFISYQNTSIVFYSVSLFLRSVSLAYSNNFKFFGPHYILDIYTESKMKVHSLKKLTMIKLISELNLLIMATNFWYVKMIDISDNFYSKILLVFNII